MRLLRLAWSWGRRRMRRLSVSLPQHTDEHCPQRAVLLAVDEQLGEGFGVLSPIQRGHHCRRLRMRTRTTTTTAMTTTGRTISFMRTSSQRARPPGSP